MGDSSALLNLGELAKPATILVERISDAVGGLFRPWQIRRTAQAEADAELILAEARIEVTGLLGRAMARHALEEGKKQFNMESITRRALPQVSDEARPEEVEEDWITHFFDRCRLVSDEAMQILWAGVLAGQANSPGSYSKRTLDVLYNLERSDALLFSILCSFAFYFDGRFIPLIYDTQSSIYTDSGINFMAVSHLESLGLIHHSGATSYARTKLGRRAILEYFGLGVWVSFDKPDGNSLDIGHVLLTQAGQELAPLCDAKPRDGFVQYAKSKWKDLGYHTDLDFSLPAEEDGVPTVPSP